MFVVSPLSKTELNSADVVPLLSVLSLGQSSRRMHREFRQSFEFSKTKPEKNLIVVLKNEAERLIIEAENVRRVF